jgi:hypothetical protein
MFDDSPRNSFLRAKDSTLLTIIVHTAAFAAEILQDDPQIWRLLELGTLGGINLLCTPHEDRAVVRRLQGKQVQCATVSEGVEWVEVGGSFLRPFRERLRRVGEWRRPCEDGSQVSIMDELFTRPYEVDLFVTAKGDPFLDRDPLRRHYVTPADAFELVRLLMVHHERYEPRRGYGLQESHYLQYRRQKLFPAYEEANAIVRTAAEHEIPEEIRRQVLSLGERIDMLLRAADQVGINALKEPNGSAPGRCAYHLSYLVMLATALYDEVAWLIAHVEKLELHRRAVGLRLERKQKDFMKKLGASNPDIVSFLSTSRIESLVSLFYPARDQFQHREIIPARLSNEPPPQIVVWELPKESRLTRSRLITEQIGES